MPEAVYNTSVYFNYTYEDEWLTSDFAKEVIRKIDKSDVKGPHAVESPVLGVISPEKLSGGTKTLLLMANDSEKAFNASTCGDNCAPFILIAGRKFGEDHCGDGVRQTEKSQITYYRYSERPVILAPAQAAIKNPHK